MSLFSKKMIIKKTTLVAALALTVNGLFAQQVLNGFIDKDLTLTGNYYVETNVKITKNATLVINQGSKIIMKKGTSIKVEGGLVINGNSGKLVTITGENARSEGAGIVISGTSARPIKINYVHFSSLLTPITFEANWHRNKVTINNNLIDNVNTGEPAIAIRRPDDIMNSDTINFSLSYNNFVSNNSSIWIDNLESDILHLYMQYNLIYDNYYYGFESGQSFNTPINSSFNNPNRKYKANISGNAIFGNYIYHNVKDTIMREINFSISGKGEQFAIPNNYFGPRNKVKVESTLDHFSNNSSSPYLDVTPLLQIPPDECHGFVYKITLNNEVLLDWSSRPAIAKNDFSLVINFNRSVKKTAEQGTLSNLSYYYYNESKATFENANVNAEILWEDDFKQLTLQVNDNVVTANPIGYFIIRGLEDTDGLPVPVVTIGKNTFQRAALNKVKDYTPTLRN